MCIRDRDIAGSEKVRAFLEGEKEQYEMEVLTGLYSISNEFEGAADVYVVSSTEPLGISNVVIPQQYLYPFNTLDWGIFRKIHTDGLPMQALLDPRDSKSFILGMEVKRNGETPIGYVLLEVERRLLSERVAESISAGSKGLLLTDDYGLVLYSTEGTDTEGLAKAWQTMEVDRSVLSEMQTEGVFPDGNGVYVKNERTGVWFLTHVSGELVEIAHHYINVSMEVAVVIILVITVILAWFLSGKLRRPFRNLESVIVRVEQGDFTARASEQGYQEIAALGQSFNHMTENLEKLIHNIEEKQRLLRSAQINALQLQVNPHFLYNALDLIRWLSREGNMAGVSVATVSLARLLRRTLDLTHDIVTVGSEIEQVEDYIAIQCLRYEDRLACEIVVPDELKACRIPKLLLLPIVENSVVHGFEQKIGMGHISIRAEKENEYIIFRIEDDGIGMSEETIQQVEMMRQDGMYGIGLSNVHKRARIFGDGNCGISIQSQLSRGSIVTLTVKDVKRDGGVV